MELFLNRQRKPIDKEKTKKMLLSSFKQNISPNTIIECVGVYKNSKNKKDKISLVSNFDLVVEKGDLITIAGESGSGKSIILKILAGFVPPDRGSVLFLNEEVSKQRTDSNFSHFFNIGYMPQFFNIGEDSIFSKTPFDELEDHAKRAFKKKNVSSHVVEIISHFNLENIRTTPCKYLSSGEIQRIILGSIFITKPKVIFLDMPLNHQDPLNASKIIDVFVNYCSKEKIAIVAITNSIPFMQKSKKTVVIFGGKIHKTEIHEDWIQAHNLKMLTSEENILNEQEKEILSYFCPLCNSELNDQPNTCPNCSAPLIWD